MAFQGYLLKAGNVDISKYVEVTTYKVTPYQRADLDSYRNGQNKLVREVAEHTTTKIEFNTVPMDSHDMTEFLQILEQAYTVPIERKLQIVYFDVVTGQYPMADVYMPDYTPQASSWNGKKLMYAGMRVAFIEY